MKNINIVLLEPEIPQNTGNIARSCAATGSALHLIEPLGFKIDDSKLKRAGLDYWHSLDINYYNNLEDFYSRIEPDAQIYYFSTKAQKLYTEVHYPGKVYIMFGRESAGIPEEVLRSNYEHCVRLPMLNGMRSLNLSNTAAVALYEVLRQRNFEGLQI